MSLKGDQATSRAINTRMLLDILLRSGPVSRAELAARTRLSPGTVTGLTRDLLANGLIRELEAGRSNGGRRPIPVAINYESRLSVGIKVAEDGLSGVLTDLAATEIATARRAFDKASIDALSTHIADMVAEFLPDPRIRQRKLIGLGLALPGFVDVLRGSVSSQGRILEADVPIASIISERIGLPVWIDNDVNAYAIAHRRFGLARGRQDVLAIIIGTGIGAAMIVNGKIHRGAHFRAGEIGFARNLMPGSAAFSFGQSYNLAGITAAWRNLGLSHADIAAALAAKDDATREFLRRIGGEIGSQIAMVSQMIDPDTIVVGGEALAWGQDFMEAIKQSLERHLLVPHGEVVFDTDNDLWGRGAAALAIDHFFDFENTSGHLPRAEAPS